MVCYLGWALVGFGWVGVVFGYVWLFAGVSCSVVLTVWMGLWVWCTWCLMGLVCIVLYNVAGCGCLLYGS